MTNNVSLPTSTSPVTSRRAVLTLTAVVTLVALASRLVGLGALQPWGDEVYSYIASADLPALLLRWETKENQLHSPLHFIEMKVSRQVFGNGALGIRLPSALYSVTGIALLCWWVAARVGLTAAAVASAFLILNPFVLEWSREGRMYSGLMFWTLLLVATALHGVHHVREKAGHWHDWPWWTVGLLFNLCHASAIWGITSIAAVGLWLGLMGLALLPRDRRAGLNILAGAALATVVYLLSWSLTGLGKAMIYSRYKPDEVPGDALSLFPRSLDASLSDLAGMVPVTVTVLVWLVALVGCVWVFAGRRRGLALLLLLLAVVPWMMYPSVIKRHFWAGRYIYIALIPLAFWLGVAVQALWHNRRAKYSWLPQGGLVAIAVLLLVVWLPIQWRVLTIPKTRVLSMMEPLRTQGAAGDAVMMLPHFYTALTEFPPYAVPEGLDIITPPRALWGEVTLVASDGKLSDPYDLPFEPVMAQAETRPANTWLLLIDPDKDTFDRLIPLTQAYGLPPETLRQAVAEHSRASTLTMRVSAAGVDHVTATVHRRHIQSWPWQAEAWNR